MALERLRFEKQQKLVFGRLLISYHIPYSRKLWRGFKFGDLANSVKIAKLKLANTDYCMHAYGAKNSDCQI